MIAFVLVALAAALPLAPVSPGRQARAMVTIVPSASLRFAEIEKARPKALRESRVRSANGSQQTVRLVEFE